VYFRVEQPASAPSLGMDLGKREQTDVVWLLPLGLMRKNEGEKFSPFANDVWVNACCFPYSN
jgi:hypothetical protein